MVAVAYPEDLIVAGIDEAGRGPLAGPVVAAAVVLPIGYVSSQIKDSKQLSKSKREVLYEEIVTVALSWSVIAVGPRRIEKINIREATRLAMSLAALRVAANHFLIDGNMEIHTEHSQETIIGGDALNISISAASIIAKVTRDRLMMTIDERYPGYDLKKHMGYGTAQHRRAIAEQGPTPVHRRSFQGVREYVKKIGLPVSTEMAS